MSKTMAGSGTDAPSPPHDKKSSMSVMGGTKPAVIYGGFHMDNSDAQSGSSANGSRASNRSRQQHNISLGKSAYAPPPKPSYMKETTPSGFGAKIDTNSSFSIYGDGGGLSKDNSSIGLGIRPSLSEANPAKPEAPSE